MIDRLTESWLYQNLCVCKARCEFRQECWREWHVFKSKDHWAMGWVGSCWGWWWIRCREHPDSWGHSSFGNMDLHWLGWVRLYMQRVRNKEFGTSDAKFNMQMSQNRERRGLGSVSQKWTIDGTYLLLNWYQTSQPPALIPLPSVIWWSFQWYFDCSWLLSIGCTYTCHRLQTTVIVHSQE